MAKSMARESLGIIGRGRGGAESTANVNLVLSDGAGGAESTADEAYVNTVPAKPG